eukprot:6108577-Amphidinium_carterae.1
MHHFSPAFHTIVVRYTTLDEGTKDCLAFFYRGNGIEVDFAQVHLRALSTRDLCLYNMSYGLCKCYTLSSDC